MKLALPTGQPHGWKDFSEIGQAAWCIPYLNKEFSGENKTEVFLWTVLKYGQENTNWAPLEIMEPEFLRVNCGCVPAPVCVYVLVVRGQYLVLSSFPASLLF